MLMAYCCCIMFDLAPHALHHIALILYLSFNFNLTLWLHIKSIGVV
jgi:hypothetical protein